MTLRSDDPACTAHLVGVVERWASRIVTDNPIVTSVERDPELSRWYVRVRGDEKTVTTVWFTLGEQAVQTDCYFMPWPEDQRADVFEYLLRSSQRFVGVRFTIGPEDALYLRSELPLAALVGDQAACDGELDQLLGATYAYSEHCFGTAMRLAFGDRFTRRS
jgi:Putative bacterial sensory transduction regulator